jgi:translation elongation factor EF-4
LPRQPIPDCIKKPTIGAKIIAREPISALRNRCHTPKCYGAILRVRKLISGKAKGRQKTIEADRKCGGTAGALFFGRVFEAALICVAI